MTLIGYLITLIAFVVLANPATFRAVRGVAGNWVANNTGLASTPGLFLHALVFIIVVGCLMTMFRTSNYMTEGGVIFETRDDADDADNKHFQQNRIVYAVTN
jgi:uncharacterized RDD family membrane protein YckC